ncbi:MAG: hypothetical protein N3C12_05165 [Candidatus Binatia bacterium]|nr:hypothetical protein [Candidatus Binatia bacterium]
MQLDPSFGSGGKLTPSGVSDDVVDVDIQTNGKIVVTARTQFVGRLLPGDGSMDQSFGTSGHVSQPGPGTVQATVIEPFWRIVVASSSATVALTAFEGDATGACPEILPDIDCDGVDDVIEESCLPGAKTQANLTASPTATGRGCVILQTNCAQNNNVAAFAENQLGSDAQFSYPYGLVGFTLTGCPNGHALVQLTVEGADSLAGITFRKHGPTTPGGTPPVFYTLADVNPAAMVLVSGNTISFELTDGEPGDDTAVDGMIVDQGGPATPASVAASVPAVALPAATFVFALLLLLGFSALARGNR